MPQGGGSTLPPVSAGPRKARCGDTGTPRLPGEPRAPRGLCRSARPRPEPQRALLRPARRTALTAGCLRPVGAAHTAPAQERELGPISRAPADGNKFRRACLARWEHVFQNRAVLRKFPVRPSGSHYSASHSGTTRAGTKAPSQLHTPHSVRRGFPVGSIPGCPHLSFRRPDLENNLITVQE